MYGLRGFEQSRLLTTNIQLKIAPGYWLDDNSGWDMNLFTIGFLLTQTRMNSDPVAVTNIFTKAQETNRNWDSSHNYGQIMSIQQIRDVKNYLVNNPNSYASLCLRSPLAFFLLIASVTAFLKGSLDKTQDVRPVVVFLTNRFFDQISKRNNVFRGYARPKLAMVVAALNSSGFISNSRLWSEISKFTSLGLPNINQSMGTSELYRYLQGYAGGSDIPNFDNQYLLRAQQQTSQGGSGAQTQQSQA